MHPDYNFFWVSKELALLLFCFQFYTIYTQLHSNQTHMLSTFSGVEMGFRAGNLVAYIELAGLQEKKSVDCWSVYLYNTDILMLQAFYTFTAKMWE